MVLFVNRGYNDVVIPSQHKIMFNISKPSNSCTLFILYQNATFNTSKHMCSHNESYIQIHLHIIIILKHTLYKRYICIYNKTSMPQIRESKKFIRRVDKEEEKKCIQMCFYFYC